MVATVIRRDIARGMPKEPARSSSIQISRDHKHLRLNDRKRGRISWHSPAAIHRNSSGIEQPTWTESMTAKTEAMWIVHWKQFAH